MPAQRIVRVRRVAENALAAIVIRRMRAGTARGVAVDRIEIGIEQGEGHCAMLRARYRLRGLAAPDARPIVLDTRACPLETVGVSGPAVRVPQNTTTRGTLLLPLELVGRDTWAGVSFDLVLRWPTGGEGSASPAPLCMVVPDLLPTLIAGAGDESVSDLPIVDVAGIARGVYCVAGVPAQLDITERAARTILLQGAVFLSAQFVELAVEGDLRVWLASRLRDDMSPGGPEWAGALVASMARFFASTWGLSMQADIVLVPPSEPAGVAIRPSGLCFHLEPRELGVSDSMADTQDFLISTRVADVWWGAGCRIRGRHGRELESGICMAAALRWLRFIGEDAQYDASVRFLQAERVRSRVRSKLLGIQGMARPRGTSAIALTLDRNMSAGPACERAIADFMRAHWGKRVDAMVAARYLADRRVDGLPSWLIT
jgi:hypothetical protein